MQWEVQNLGTLSKFEDAYVKEFNDNGHALIVGKKHRNKGSTCSWSLWDPQIGLISIKDPNGGTIPYQWHCVNGHDVVAGLRNITRSFKGKITEYRTDLITWHPQTGTKFFTLPLKTNQPCKTFIARCRNSDLIIMSCTNNPKRSLNSKSGVFAMINDQLQDLTPMLQTNAELLGYVAANWLVIAANSQGMLLGRFDYYETNPYKNIKSPVGTRYFTWDGNEMSLIDYPNDLLEGLDFFRDDNFFDANYLSLDATGNVLFNGFVKARRSWESWLWSKKDGLKRLNPREYMSGNVSARTIGLLDDGTIVWFVTSSECSNGYLFQKEGQVLLVPLDNNLQPLPEHLKNYPNLHVKTHALFGTWYLYDNKFNSSSFSEFNVNMNKQIFFSGKIFGEDHPFLLDSTAAK